jgi:hypothetical protein
MRARWSALPQVPRSTALPSSLNPALTSKTVNPGLGVHGRFGTGFADEEPAVGLAEESSR